MAIEIKSPREINAIRASCRIAVETLHMVGERIRAGLTTDEINRWVHDDTIRRGAVPSPLNYHGFPKSVCTSVNDVVCHGIPGPLVLRDGDIINVDITSLFQGFHGDTSATFYVGKPSPQARHVTEVARRCLQVGIEQVRDGARIGDIGAAIQAYAESKGCSAVRQFVGHGIGRRFHEPPQVAHFGARGKGERMRPGMVFTIEPMINLGGWEVEILSDNWTAVTQDRSLSAQFEHTVVVLESGCEVLTARDRPLVGSEIPELMGVEPAR